MRTTLASAVALLSSVGLALAAPPLASPIVIASGGTAHVTPVDQSSAPISPSAVALVNLPATLATSMKDSTGFVITAIAPGTYAGVRLQWSDGVNPAVLSPAFTVTVSAPPPVVTAVGSTSP